MKVCKYDGAEYIDLWEQLKDKLDDMMDSYDFDGATADDAGEQLEAYAKKDLCGELLDMMDKMEKRWRAEHESNHKQSGKTGEKFGV